MSKIDQVVDTLLFKKELSPKFWLNNKTPNDAKLKSAVRKKLLEISNEFVKFLDLDVFISDITMTGSLANLNWSSYSDVDLHLIFDYDQIKSNEELYKEFFNLKKIIFNNTHEITVFGHDVEMYIQDSKEPHHSSGVYSVLYDEWIETPKIEDVKIDKKVLIGKIKSFVRQFDLLMKNIDEDNISDSIDLLDNFKDKVKKYRSSGLEKEGEKSYENLVFKFLRRSGLIQKLFDKKTELMDKSLSLESINRRNKKIA